MATFGDFLLLIVPFFVMIILGLPIYLGFLATCFLYIAVDPRLTLQMIPPILYSGLDSFPILAIPLFIFAGDIMAGGKISEKLLVFAEGIVGRLPGSTGAVTVLGSMFFGAVSGSGPATTAAIGGMTVPRMTQQPGYSRGYITSLLAASGFLGVLIPPSIPFVMFGYLTNTSIGDLFIAGIVPGVTIGILYILWNTYYARKHNIPLQNEREMGFFKSLYQAIWALLMPLIILGGIYGGVFTPTEAAAVAVVYAMIIALFVYRTVTVKDIFVLAGRTAYTMLTFMLIFVFANVFSRIMTMTNMTQLVIDAFTSISSSNIVLLLLINLFLFLLGMVMDPVTGIILVVPLFFPLATRYMGLNPVHFGAMVVTNLAVAMITPPMAGNLFVAMRLTKTSVGECLKALMPFVLIGIGVVFLVTYVPGFPLLILNLLGK